MIEVQQFDLAMLRCLGWQNSQITKLIILKVSLFYILPGASLGILSSYLLLCEAETFLSRSLQMDVTLSFGTEVVVVGVAIAVLLPLLSMITPLIKTSQASLRDSLDVFSKANKITASVVTIEQKIGISFNQLFLGLILTFYGLISFTVIPASLIYKKFGVSTFCLLLIATMSVFGVILVLQHAVLPFSKALLQPFYFVR